MQLSLKPTGTHEARVRVSAILKKLIQVHCNVSKEFLLLQQGGTTEILRKQRKGHTWSKDHNLRSRSKVLTHVCLPGTHQQGLPINSTRFGHKVVLSQLLTAQKSCCSACGNVLGGVGTFSKRNHRLFSEKLAPTTRQKIIIHKHNTYRSSWVLLTRISVQIKSHCQEEGSFEVATPDPSGSSRGCSQFLSLWPINQFRRTCKHSIVARRIFSLPDLRVLAVLGPVDQ